MIDRTLVKRGAYHDSVTLMLVARQARALDGVVQAAAVAATPVNLELLTRLGLQPGEVVSPDDLVVAVRAESEAAAAAALAAIEAGLARRGQAPQRAGQARPPRSLGAAARRDPDLALALVSVPGRHAAYEVAAALDAGLHVFCFSDGVGVDQEVALKQAAVQRGLLLMGPDCGTAIIDGVGLGFANAVRRGPVGVVGASGTGTQAVTCLLDAAGVGISQAVGVGGRDLDARVGGLMTRHALGLLTADAGTQVLLLVSKPPDPRVAAGVAVAAAATGKPAVVAFPGLDPGALPGPPRGVELAGTLEQAAARAAALAGATPAPQAGEPTPDAGRLPGTTPGAVRGLFAGGTLCAEAMALVAAAVGRVGSNQPLRPDWQVDPTGHDRGHVFIDFGSDQLTEGRPHPMIDPALRAERFQRDAADPAVGVILLDVVLGYGADPDPAATFAPLVERALAARRGRLTVVVSLCGAAGDPQDLASQAARLRQAGALVSRSNAAAARLALAAAGLAGVRR